MLPTLPSDDHHCGFQAIHPVHQDPSTRAPVRRAHLADDRADLSRGVIVGGHRSFSAMHGREITLSWSDRLSFRRSLVMWVRSRMAAVFASIYADHRIMWTGVLNWPPVSPESLLGNTVVPHNHGCRL
jgi:hypothetical protein